MSHFRYLVDLFRLTSFALPPSMIVETRNGYQPYWLIEGASVEQFRDVQRRLIAFFGTDPIIKNPARVMRLPGYDWVKLGKGFPRFKVEVIQHTDRRYPIDELLAALPPVREQGTKRTANSSKHLSTPNNIKTYTYDSDIGGTQLVHLSEGSSSFDVVDWLKRQSLPLYLGLSNNDNFQCPFHPDNDPSASVYRATSGHWLFKCHSSHCGKQGSIIDLARQVHHLPSDGAAIEHLRKQFNIGALEEGWRQNQRDILQRNIDLLNDPKMWKTSYPFVYRLIRRALHDLIAKHEYAKTHLIGPKASYEGKAIFYGSLRQFDACRGGSPFSKWKNSQNIRVDRYCLLGLLRKLADGEIPDWLLKRANANRIERRYQHRTGFYCIPEYTSQLLTEADARAKVLVQNRVSLNGISKESINSTFGERVAKQVYPQAKTLAMSEGAASFSKKLEEIVLDQLASYGFARLTTIQNAMLTKGTWKTVSARRIRKYLPAIMKKHDLESKYADAATKKSLGIAVKGSPVIIVKAIKGPSNAAVSSSLPAAASRARE